MSAPAERPGYNETREVVRAVLCLVSIVVMLACTVIIADVLR